MAKIKSIQIQNLHNNGKLYEVGKKGVNSILDASTEYQDEMKLMYLVKNKAGEIMVSIENCPALVEYDVPENEKPIQKEIFPKEKKEKLTIEQRKDEFVKSFKPHLEKYGAEVINEFIAYWAEPNQANTKMKFELEKTWSNSGRLATWVKRSKQFNNKESDNEQPEKLKSW